MFGGNDKSPGLVLMEIAVAVVMFMGTIFIVAYKGSSKITKWGIARYHEKKERERISKL